ncbi:MAG TPA: TIGR03560 family F420-dependent LLM class oxidoreductase [Solirubrobacteraceae bacterium]|nr:TIGR03560 family F420-dependent LLM class oxidoreductase [Solirubrobacteraceae bacterium]
MAELAVLLEPRHGASYEQILQLALAAEESGLDAFFRSDHYLGVDPGDAEYRSTDSWITIAGLARETTRIRLGTLVTAGTFRLPGPLAVAVATANAMSGGRVELGLGAGWYEEEHGQFGIPFPPLAERFDRLEEQLEILSGLWRSRVGAAYSFDGRHYAVDANRAFAATWPPHPAPPIIVGGLGPRRTPELAARFADEFNAAFAPLDVARQRFAQVKQRATELGRDPSDLRLSIVIPRVCVGVDEAEVRRRLRILGPPIGAIPDQGLAGSPAYVAERLAEWIDAGADRIYIHLLDVDDVEHVRLLGEQIAPSLRRAAVAATEGATRR